MTIESSLDKQAHPLLPSAAYVVEHASHVSIDLKALNTLAADLSFELSSELSKKFSETHWLESAPALVKNYFAALTLQNRILFLTIFHTIGFCYWGENSENPIDISVNNKRWTVTLGEADCSETKHLSTQVFSKTDLPSSESTYDGTMALLVSMASNANFLNIDYLASLTFEQFKTLLAGQFSENIDFLTLLEVRHELIVNLAQKLRSENYLQSLLPLLATTSAIELALKLSSELPGFSDIAHYKGAEIFFLKRAQLLVSDINHTIVASGENISSLSSVSGDKPLTGITKVEELTAFADYKLPQLLRHHQVISYEPTLATKVDQQIELEPGSEEEVELRAAAIIAVELMRQALAQKGIYASAALVDNQLWLMSQKLDKTKVKPYHRCRTIFY